MKINRTEDNKPDEWNKMRNGDKEAMLVLYRFYYNDLLSYGVQLCHSMDTAKDAINDIFLHLWESHSKLSSVKNVKAYLFACLRRRINHTDYFNHKVLPENNLISGAQFEASYEEVLIAMQHSEHIRIRVKAALDKLTPRQKELITLRYFNNMNYEQIGIATGMSVKTAYNTVYNAAKILANELRDVLLTILVACFFE